MPNRPFPFIQNHINWCWATAAKIVGLDYCASLHRSPAHSIDAHAVVRRTDLTGLRSDYIGSTDGQVFVDAWQQEIVLHAKNQNKNPDGNMPESDEGKCRALRYVVTSDPLSSSLDVVSCGQYNSSLDLLTSDAFALQEINTMMRSIVGNYVKHDGKAHSLVLYPEKNQHFTLYDPWDGFTDIFSIKQIFQTGFLTNQGPGVVRWIQYIR